MRVKRPTESNHANWKMRLPLHTLSFFDESKGGRNTANYSLNVLPSLTWRRMNARTAPFNGDSPRVPSVQLEIMGMILSQALVPN